MHETNSENESTDEQNVSFLKNIVIEYQCLIKKYQKSHDVLDSQKSEISLLCKEYINHIKKIQFIESEYQYLLKRSDILTRENDVKFFFSNEAFKLETKMLDDILDK